MATKQDAGGMSIRVHPLVVMSIADHYTRNVQQYNKHRAIGALFGIQSGRDVQVYDTFEIALKTENKEGVAIDHEHFETDLKLYKEAFPAYECLGWYSTGGAIRPEDSGIHEEMARYNERPLFLLLDAAATGDLRDLPLAVYEEDVHVVDDKSTKTFVKTVFKIQADEAERITAVHCAKVAVGQQGGSSVTSHFGTLHKSVKALKERVQVLHSFLRDVDQGKIQADQQLLRSIRGICNRLPTMDSPQFADDFVNEYNDALVVTYLAMVTKGSDALSGAIDKFNTAYAFSGGARRGGGRMAPGMMAMGGGMF